MKLKLFVAAILLSGGYLSAQNGAAFSTDGGDADASAILEARSTTKGVLIPRMTAVQRQAIASPANGLLVFDTDSAAVFVRSNNSWTKLLKSNTDFTWVRNGADLMNANTGVVGIGAASSGARLQVENTSAPLAPQLQLQEIDGSNYVRLVMKNKTAGSYWTMASRNKATAAEDTWSLFHSAAGETLQMNGAGNMGIGAEPEPGSQIIQNRLTVDGGNTKGAIRATSRSGSSLLPTILAEETNSATSSGTAIAATSTNGIGLLVSAPRAIIVSGTGNSGFGVANPLERIDVAGGVKLGNTSGSNAGTIRYNGTDIQGYVGGVWRSLTGSTVTTQWTENGSNITNANTGNVGIGASPAADAKLDVSSALARTIHATNSSTGAALSATANTGNAAVLNTATGNGLLVNVTDASGKGIVVVGGRSGFGVLSPTETVDVSGAIRVGSTTNTNAGTIRYNGSDLQGYVGGQWKSLTQSGFSLPYSGTAATSGQNLEVINTADNSSGIAGRGNGASFSTGVTGTSSSTTGRGVVGNASSATGTTYGVVGTAGSESGTGVYGFATDPSGLTTGVSGLNLSTNGVGVIGNASAASGLTTGVRGVANSPAGTGGTFSNGNAAGFALRTETGKVKLADLAGTGSRMVITDAAGQLGTQAIPGGFTLPYTGTAAVSNTGGIAVTNTGFNGYGLSGTATGGDEGVGVFGSSSTSLGTGVVGLATNSSGNSIGVSGNSNSTTGVGVRGAVTTTTGFNTGVFGTANSSDGTGVNGVAYAATGGTVGVRGSAASPAGFGGYFRNTNGGVALRTEIGSVQMDALAGTGNRMVVANGSGVLATQAIPGGFTLPYSGTSSAAKAFELTVSGTNGVWSANTATSGYTSGVLGSVQSPDGTGVYGQANANGGASFGVYGSSASAAGSGVYGTNTATGANATGVTGVANANEGRGVYGVASATSGANAGVQGISYSTAGVGGTFSNTQANGFALKTGQGKVQLETLSGTGSRMVVADANGQLATQPITGFTLPYFGASTTNNPFEITTSGANAIKGSSSATTGYTSGIQGITASPNGSGVYGQSTATSGTPSGVYGGADGVLGAGVRGANISTSGDAPGVVGTSQSTTGKAVMGVGSSNTGSNAGVYGLTYSPAGTGGLFANIDPAGFALTTEAGKVKLGTLSGTGSRMVVADANGQLSAQTLPVSGQWTVAGNDIYNSNSGNVVVGATTAKAAFNVAGQRTVLFGDDSLGAGVKLMWLPTKKAFRAGEVETGSDNWNPANVGSHSFAAGRNSKASGAMSTALGNATATGQYSIAAGSSTASALYASAFGSSTAAGIYATAGGSSTAAAGGAVAFGENSQALEAASTAIGYYNQASGQGAVALGYASYSRGLGSLATGLSSIAKGNGAVTVGMLNDSSDVADLNNPQPTERIFQVGNGTYTGLFGPNTRSTAFTILRNGNTGIGTTTPGTKLEVAGQIKITGGTPGLNKVLTSDANGLASWQDAPGGGSSSGWGLNGNSGTTNTNFLGTIDPVDLNVKTYNTTRLVVSSVGVITATGDASQGFQTTVPAGHKMMWIPARKAFRAGEITGTQWSDINTGNWSTAFGYNVMATGQYTFAAGNASTAGPGGSAFALGQNAGASGANSFALGHNLSAGMVGSACLGDQDYSNTLSATDMYQMNMRFKGGYRLFTTSASVGGSAVGVQLVAGGNSWTTISDVRRKENFETVDAEIFLQRIASMPLSSWNYKGQDARHFRHYGPMAQDFYAAFGRDSYGTIGSDTTIASADFDGINLIAIQALEKRTAELRQANAKLMDQNRQLTQELAGLQAQLQQQSQMALRLSELEKAVQALAAKN